VNIAIIVAAGSGSRFAADKPKQFTELLGKPLIIHTLERFEACPAVDEIVLVLSDEGRAEFEILNLKFQIKKIKTIVSGGATRAESVLNGLSVVCQNNDASVVAIHDGARPLVSVDEVEMVVAKAQETGAACLVAPVTDTIKSLRGDEIGSTLDRNKLRRALTPQAFRVELLMKAYSEYGPGAILDTVTDECYLVEKLGVPIAAVEGSSRNIKITRPEDLVFAEAILKSSY